MMKKILFSLVILTALISTACDTVYEVLDTVYTNGPVEPSITEMTGGLKNALEVGTGIAVSGLNKKDGFFGDPLVRIPFPEEAQFAANALNTIGLGGLVTEFEKLLNKGAEEGAAAALPIFKNAIKSMTIQDAKNILLGGDNAATQYFETKTRGKLQAAFSPYVKDALDKVNATKAWSDLTTAYNNIPLTNKDIETDIVKYATDKALDGLFLKVAEQEKLIRQDPIKRTTDLLKKVFGYADTQKE
jgi:hypothetical protein